MKIGLSTYAFFWHISNKNPHKLNPFELLRKTKELGGEVFQFCDYPLIESLSDQELLKIYKQAKELNIELEIGTRGVEPSHLLKYLHIAKVLDAKVVRSMFNAFDDQLTLEEVCEKLAQVVEIFQKEDVKLAFETYEQVKTKDIVDVIKNVNSSTVGVCLDPGNSIAALEMPNEVIKLVAPFVTNLHIKDFQFTRKEGWVGFALTGAPLGEGLLDLNYMLKALKESNRDVNAILEFWLPFHDTIDSTLNIEMNWIKSSLKFLRRKIK